MKKNISKFVKNALSKRNVKMWVYPAVYLVVVVVFAFAVGMTWNSVAKYFQTNDKAGEVKAGTFYFTSDYLLETPKEYHLAPGDGTVSVSFDLRNYDGLNVSDTDINYTVTVSPALSGEAITGKLEAAGGKQSNTIILNGLKAGTSYTVTVVGENGYSQTLSAVFTVDEILSGVYKNTKNYGDYVLLTIWTEGVACQASFTVPENLIPDETDDALLGKVAGTKVDVDLKFYESVTFRFFTTDAYNESEITVMVGTETNVPETVLN